VSKLWDSATSNPRKREVLEKKHAANRQADFRHRIDRVLQRMRSLWEISPYARFRIVFTILRLH
jgi:hypothetical protein